MCCLYCGKEIGAFRLLRDSEFCSVAHRKKYGERLGKALHDIAAPEPAPAGIAGFRDSMPVQCGNTALALHTFQRGPEKEIRIRRDWPLNIDTSDPDVVPEAPEAPVVAEQQTLETPPMVQRWMAPSAPEPAPTGFLHAAAALSPQLASPTPRFAAELEPTPVVDSPRHFPALCESWVAIPAAEPVAMFVQACAAAIALPSVLAPRFAAELEPTPVVDAAGHAPFRAERWLTIPAPEPVAAFVQVAQATEPVQGTHILQLPRFTAELEPTPVVDVLEPIPSPCETWVAAAAPEPVAAFVQFTAALTACGLALRLPGIAATLGASTPEIAEHVAVAAAEPVAMLVQPAAALTPAFIPGTLRFSALAPAALHGSSPSPARQWIAPTTEFSTSALDLAAPALALTAASRGASPLLPAPQFTADLEPLPALDDLLEPPAMIEAFMAAAAPEPVHSFLQTSVAGALELPATVMLPQPLGELAALHVPRIKESHAAPPAEAVMAEVIPAAATAPLVLLRKTEIALPAVPVQAAADQFETALTVLFGAQPEATEAHIASAQSATPISIQRTQRPSVTLAEPPAICAPAPVFANFKPGLVPAALESLLITSYAGPLPMAVAPRLLPLVLAVSQEHAIPSFQAQQVAPAIAQPAPAAPRQEEPQPVATISVAQPVPAVAALEGVLPQRDMQPVEFHTARLHSEAVGRPEWIAPRLSLMPPRFSLRAALDKLEDPAAQQKIARKEPEILNMPPAKRRPTVLMVAGRIAASFLLASSLWYGMTNLRTDRRVSSEDLASSAVTLSPGVAPNSAPAAVGTAPAPAPKGTMARVRQAIADRAALTVAENFRSTDSWQGVEQARPAGWKRHADGYMNTGALALFSPTLKFKDYRMEFFGQIENKSLGWTVRATDPKNYHAMKLTVIEAGTRPFVALVQYNVVDGKAGRKTQTPLSIMVHNNRPMQFAVDVKGNRFVTSIDGEEVDSFTDGTLVAGGVGFFSEAGERARLYWLRVARNDDWLGHVCAMLADGVATASLRAPANPSMPMPGLPAEDGLTLGAVWIALPYLSNSRRSRLSKSRLSEAWRNQPWNS